MTSLRNRAFEAGVKGISGKNSVKVRLTGESRVGAVIIDERLETGGTTDGLS